MRTLHPLARGLSLAVAVALASTITTPLPVASQGLTCDLSGFSPAPGLSANMAGGRLILAWDGASTQRLRLTLAVADGSPIISELAIRSDDTPRTIVASNAAFEFKIVEGFRRISNQQLVPLRALDVELTQEVVDRYKWDAFWDAPLDLRDGSRAGNPPPVEGVAGQPGCLDRLMRSVGLMPRTPSLRAV